MRSRLRRCGRRTVAALAVGGLAGLLASAAAAEPGGAGASATPSEATATASQPAPTPAAAGQPAGAPHPAPGATASQAPPPVPAAGEKEGADVDLDRLLRLPNSYEADVDRRGGATAGEWRARFADARKQVADAHKRLDSAEAELAKASGSSSAWQVSAPGTDDPQTGPISLRLREKIRSEREAIAKAERKLRALEVQADLAAVPPDWRSPAAAGRAEEDAPAP